MTMPGPRVFAPFAEFSPEWQAMRWAASRQFEPFTAPFAVGTRVTAASFTSALGFDPGRRGRSRCRRAEFFENAATASDDPGAQQVYAVLERVMRRSLTGLTQVLVPR